MIDVTNPQRLQRRLELIERRLAQIERTSGNGLSVSANQQGPLPGWLTAGQFGPGVLSKSALHIKNDGGAQAGSSPRMSITDPNGVVRAEAGFLAANGNSPQQWGFRASDAGNVPIFDSLGLINVMSRLANDQTTTNTTISGTGSFHNVPGSGTSFSVARAIHVLVIAVAQGTGAVTGTGTAQYQVVITQGGSTTGSVFMGVIDYANPGIMSVFGSQIVALPAANTYTVTQQANPPGTSTLNVFFGSAQVYLLGG